MFMCQRELRVVPKGWQHPTHLWMGKTVLTGLCPRSYLEGEVEEDEEPIPEEDCMPSVEGLSEEETEIAAYETVSEGTPISPTFPNSPEGRFELVKWCETNAAIFGTDRKTDGETWAGILFGKGVAMFDGQRVIVMGGQS